MGDSEKRYCSPRCGKTHPLMQVQNACCSISRLLPVWCVHRQVFGPDETRRKPTQGDNTVGFHLDIWHRPAVYWPLNFKKCLCVVKQADLFIYLNLILINQGDKLSEQWELYRSCTHGEGRVIRVDGLWWTRLITHT